MLCLLLWTLLLLVDEKLLSCRCQTVESLVPKSNSDNTNEINLSFALHDNSSNDDVLNNGWCFGLINKRVSWHETTRCYGFEYGASSASPRMFYQAIDGFPDGVWR